MSAVTAPIVLADRYRLEQQMASGGYGEVWRGTDLLLARPVAVKLMHPESAGDPQAVGRFRDEARRAGTLAHQGIARIYDYDDPGLPQPPFLVMEFVDGTSLAEVLANGPLEPARVMDIVAQAAAALHAAHRAGLVHRHIKPDNVLLSRDGLVKLADFGISQAAGPTPAAGAETPPGVRAYLAPE